MKSTQILLKALDIELKKMLSADIKKFRDQQQVNNAINQLLVKKAA